MKKSKSVWSVSLAAAMVLSSAGFGNLQIPTQVKAAESVLADNKTPAPKAWGATPNTYQYEYQKEELAAFCHFGMNTFTYQEWGNGKENPKSFNPTGNVDAETLVKTLKAAGFEKLIVTAKHHDGFCIWDSKYTEHDVASSPYKKDVLAEISKACSDYDMDMGLYLSPWDVNAKSYGYFDENGKNVPKEQDKNGDYNEYYNNQLIEILGNDKYGNKGVFKEVWMDGARNNNDTYKQEYTFEKWHDTIQKYEGKAAGRESDCMIFGGGAYSTVRWVGNEKGLSDDGVWSKSKVDAQKTGMDSGPKGNHKVSLGYEDGNQWTVSEADTKITSGWFWGPNKKVPLSMEDLGYIYFNSVGLNSTLLLNVPLNTAGGLDNDIKKRVDEFGEAIRSTFKDNLAAAKDASISASSVRGNDIAYGPEKVLDGKDDTYWTTDDGTTTGSLTIDLGGTKRFNVVSIEEAIQLGQRIKTFTVEYKNGAENEWRPFASGKTIGAKRLCRKSEVIATHVRINITGCNEVPVISEVGVYKAPKEFELKSNEIPEGFTLVDSSDTNPADGNGFRFIGNWSDDNGDSFIGGNGKWANPGAEVEMTFTGTKAWIIGTKDSNHGSADVYIDNTKIGSVNTNAASRSVQQILYETPDLEKGTHKIKLSNFSKAIGVDAMYTVNNDGKGYFEFEKEAYETGEDTTLTVKVVRKGGKNGKATVLLQDNPGTAQQPHYKPTDGVLLTFGNGETEKTVDITIKRNTDETGDLAFTVDLVKPTDGALLGFVDSAEVTIHDKEMEEKPMELLTDGSTVVLEAEDFELQPISGDKYVRVDTKDWASNGAIINWFEPGNVIRQKYTTHRPGIYTVTAYYRSGRNDSSNPNRLCWSGDKIVAGQVDVLGEKNATTTHQATFKVEITKAGEGYFVLTADEKAGPQLDKLEFVCQVDFKADLQYEIVKKEDMAEKDYSADSWKEYQNALKEAEEMAANDKATEDQLKAAREKLKVARESLVKVPAQQPGTEQPGEKPEEKPGDKPGEKPGDKPGEKPEEKPGENPVEKPVEKPIDRPIEKPSDPVLPIGTVKSKGNYNYKVTGTDTVSVTKPKKKNLKKITIYNTVKLGSKTYKVTAVADSAFKNYKAAKSVIIGTNVKEIGKKAFMGCKAVKSVKVRGTLLKKVGKQAFKGTAAKLVVKVPSKKVAAYKKLFKGKKVS